MTDKNGTTTTATIWQDNHSGLRRHRLMTKELADTIPPLYAKPWTSRRRVSTPTYTASPSTK